MGHFRAPLLVIIWVSHLVSMGAGCVDTTSLIALEKNASNKHPWKISGVILSLPIGEGPGNGRQFEKDDFSGSQWNNRQVTPWL